MKVKFGSLIVNGSGSVGGHVISTNRGGAFMRTKVTPVNPNTSYQAHRRGRFGSIVTLWKGLTDAQRLTWTNAVPSWKSTDIFGDIVNPSGANLYTKINSNLRSILQPPLNEAPDKIVLPFSPIVSVIGYIGLDYFRITFANNDMDLQTMQFWATPIVSNGVTYVKNQYVNLYQGESNYGEFLVPYVYVPRFGPYQIGSKIFIGCRVMGHNGQPGIIQYANVDIVA
jgi:hypothetical protein